MTSEDKVNKKIHPLYKYNPPIEVVAGRLPSVDVVIPSYNNQEVLDLTLTALERINYPSKLVKIYVLDDGSEKAIKAPVKFKFKVEVCRKEPKSKFWGKAMVTNLFSHKFKSELIWFLDSDMIVEADHLLNLVRAIASNKNSVALGYKKFVKEYESDVAKFKSILETRDFDDIYPESYNHDYWENLVENSNNLQDINHDIYKSLVGASFLISNSDYKMIGGYENIASAEDTVLGYEGYVKGLKFLPVKDAKSYHLGSSTMQNHQEVMLNHNMAVLADKVPSLYHYRSAPYATYEREHTLVVYRYKGESFEKFTKNLRGITSVSTSFKMLFIADLLVLEGKYRAVSDEFKELRKIHNYYKSSPNVEFLDIREFDTSINGVLNRLAESYAVLSVYLEGDLDGVVDFKKMYKFFRPSNKVAIGGLDAKDSKLIITAPALLNRYKNLISERSEDVTNLYYDLLNFNYFEWMTFERLIANINERKDYWKFIKYVFRRLRTIRNLNDLKSFVIKGRIIIRNYLGNK